MKTFNNHFLKLSGLMAAFLFTLATPGLSQAGVVAGPDLWNTDPSTFFNGNTFHGVPIGSFDFGDGDGSQTLGSASTIVMRTDDVPDGGGTTPIEILALRLVSIDQIDLTPYGGSGVGYLYVTLSNNQSGLTGVPRYGLDPNTMQIKEPVPGSGSGTFSSYLDFFVDFYKSASDGSNPTPIGGPFEVMLGAWNVPWSSTLPAPAGSSECPPNEIPIIPGECHGVNKEGVHQVTFNGRLVNDFNPADFPEKRIPEPSTIALFGVGLTLFGYSRRKTAFRSNRIAA